MIGHTAEHTGQASAAHTLRLPLGRGAHAQFTAIAPKNDCDGCQAHFKPPIIGVICYKDDPFSPPCKDLFDLEDLRGAIRQARLSA